MHVAYHAAKTVSIVLFVYYGTACLVTQSMIEEFERFGLARYRRLTGALELLGGLGLLGGYVFGELTIVAASGLALLMALGVVVRVRVRDSLLQMLPAIFLMLVNLFIVIAHVRLGSA